MDNNLLLLSKEVAFSTSSHRFSLEWDFRDGKLKYSRDEKSPFCLEAWGMRQQYPHPNIGGYQGGWGYDEKILKQFGEELQQGLKNLPRTFTEKDIAGMTHLQESFEQVRHFPDGDSCGSYHVYVWKNPTLIEGVDHSLYHFTDNWGGYRTAGECQLYLSAHQAATIQGVLPTRSEGLDWRKPENPFTQHKYYTPGLGFHSENLIYPE